MGKRSDFQRFPRDAYDTPPEAVQPLLAHLRPKTKFIEPCVGNGHLLKALCAAGHSWVDAYDIEPAPGWRSADALTEGLTPANAWADCFITNPPWDRKILHPLIEHLTSMRPTWLLFDADWYHTQQSAAFAPWRRKVVSVGRVKWIPGSKMTGKDNCCWYLFDRSPHQGPTLLYGRESPTP